MQNRQGEFQKLECFLRMCALPQLQKHLLGFQYAITLSQSQDLSIRAFFFGKYRWIIQLAVA